MNAPTPWRLTLFGGLRAECGAATVVTRFRTHKIGALLAYLALYLDRPQPREELADLFWPDSDLESARANLRTALASLRRLLEGDDIPSGSILQAVGYQTVHLSSAGVTADAPCFEHLLQTAARPGTAPAERLRALSEAVELYTGPLLLGFSEPWALTKRDRLQEAYLRALGDLTHLQEEAGNLDSALEFARRALVVDSLREEAHADLIRLLMRSGQTGAARRQFDTLARQLKEQLNAEPAPATRALLSMVSEAPAEPARPVAPPTTITPQAIAVTPVSTPPASTAGLVRLPPTFTRFFGREEEVSALADLLRDGDTPLVTVTGPGGSGKTRLAIEATRSLGSHFPGGIFFAPLADIGGPERIGDAVANAIGLPRSPGTGMEHPLQRAAIGLQQQGEGRPLLLVLDNFEQLVESGGVDAVYELLAAVPHLTCLVTSRQRLLLEGEREFPLLPLPVPTQPATPELLMEFPSVQLFVNRAQAARPDFQLSERNHQAVARLCTRLDGIPLAIEIAASWAQTLTPALMLERLSSHLLAPTGAASSSGFDLLVSRRRDVSTRHATLRATIQWSYDLLAPELQRTFALLSVFRGGWTLEAAEAICEATETAPTPLVSHLATLRDHSQIVAETEAVTGAMRYRLLETLREFASDQLTASDRERLQQRHAAYFADLAQEAEPSLLGPGQPEWLDRLEREHSNLRTAIQWCIAATDMETEPTPLLLGRRLGASLWRFWMLRGYLAEGRQYLDTLLTPDAPASQEHDRLRALLLNGAGCLARLQGDNSRARPLLEQALASMRRQRDKHGTAMCLQNLAIVLHDGGDYAAVRPLYEEALALRRSIGDRDGVANVLNSLGVLALDQGDSAGARRLYEESLALRREMGQPPRVTLLINLANLAWHQKDYSASRRYFEEGITLGRTTGNKQALGTALSGLGVVLGHIGEFATGWQCLDEALRLFQELGDIGSLADTLECCAALATNEDDSSSNSALLATAARLWGTAEVLREQLGMPLSPNERTAYEASVSRARAIYGASAFEAAWSAGRALTREQATAEAHATAARSASFSP